MADDRSDLILRLLREFRGDFDNIKERLDGIEQRMDEVHESMYTALGIAGHANVRHDSVSAEIKAIKARLTKLEENA
ncbi:MAG: hypothetical protein OXR62_09035 [Ahrensia sp.]|nr:hypothetical protein [Ahrensia sp.]